MKKSFRFFSLLFALMMVISIIPIGTIRANAETTTVKEKLDAFIKQYPSGTVWTGSFDGGIECYGFGKMVMYNVFGDHKGWLYNGTATKNMTTVASITSFSEQKVKNLLSKAKCGDILQFDTPNQHTLVVYSVNESNFYVYDCNCVAKNTVSKRKVTYKSWSGWNSDRLTLLRSKNYPSDTHTLSVRYNSNGASIDCKRYIVDTGVGLTLRSTYSTSGTKLAVIPDNTQITVTDIKSSGGYTWGKTTYDSKTGWCALAEGSEAYAYKRFYLNSDNVYLTNGKTAFAQTLSQGVEKDLYNYTTFGLNKDGCSFVGWCASPDGSTTIYDQDDATLKPETICPDLVNNDCTVTLYAIWQANVKEITGVSVESNPSKTSYYVGDTFDPSGLVLRVNYSDSTFETVTQGFDLDYDFETEGSTSVEIGYRGVFTTVNVTVEAPSVTVDESKAIGIGQTVKLSVSTTPAGQEVRFISFDPEIATVDASGNVMGIANGTVDIGVLIEYNEFLYSNSCSVVVGTGVVEEAPEIDPDAVQIAFESEAVKAGETVDVFVVLKNAPAIDSMSVSGIAYDQNVLTLEDVEWLIPGMMMNSYNPSNGKGVAAFNAKVVNGQILKLTFAVDPNVEGGDYSVTCTVSGKIGAETVEVATVPGVVKVSNFTIGDLNGDDTVTSADAIYILYYTFFPEDYPLNQNCDFTKDGVVTSADAIYLLYYTFFPEDYPLA